MKMPMTIDEYLAIGSLAHLPIWDALELLAALINDSTDQQRHDGAEHAITLASTITTAMDPLEQAHLDYFVSNAWAVLHDGSDTTVWNWGQPAFIEHVYRLRRALRAHPDRPSKLRQQILTNMGNAMDRIGRVVEALRYWERALADAPSFGMALGNRGIGRLFYGKALYDVGHQYVFDAFAHRDLVEAQGLPLEGGAGPYFLEHQVDIEVQTTPELRADYLTLREFPLGDDPEEVAYRTWCLNERLFLNPLNDLGPHSIAARDVLSTPSMKVRIGVGPVFQGFYNQLKQEFVSARYHLYEAIHTTTPHYSDRDVLLVDTLDYPAYSLAAERLRGAFRTFYGLFDKIAFFLNRYLNLGIADGRVSIKKLWYDGDPKKKALRKQFADRKNWSLRGLFALSKDLVEDDEDALDALEPEAQQLAKIRNHLEHRFLKLHDELWDSTAAWPPKDDSVLSVGRADFTSKTLHLARLARAALIYLSLAVHQEERERDASDEMRASPFVLPTASVLDHFKR